MTTHATTADAPVDSFARKALFASAIGYAMDGFDLLILGFMLRAISADLGLTPPQAGSLITWTLVGAVAGGILFGMLADYYGRVRVLTWTIMLFPSSPACAPSRKATGTCDLSHHCRPRPRRRVRHRHGAGGGSLAGEQARAGDLLCRARLAGRPAAGGAGDTGAAAAHRLAQHVPGRASSRRRRLCGALVCRRAEDFSGAREAGRTPCRCGSWSKTRPRPRSA